MRLGSQAASRWSRRFHAPFRHSPFHPGSSSPFYVSLRGAEEIENVSATLSRISLTAVPYATCTEGSQSRYQPFGAADDEMRGRSRERQEYEIFYRLKCVGGQRIIRSLTTDKLHSLTLIKNISLVEIASLTPKQKYGPRLFAKT